jgi:uncharacterized protein YjbI with pentapeptide repeats
MLLQGAGVWNAWRTREALIEPDLSGANLLRADLSEANLSGANLHCANLNWANLWRADLRSADLSSAKLAGADLSEADLFRANLSGVILGGADLRRANFSSAKLIGADLNKAILFDANLSSADLSKADISQANFLGADLSKANLSGADLEHTILVKANLRDADLTGCRVYGTSIWNVDLSDSTKQQNLIITSIGEPKITVDNIEIAQFIYLLLNNQRIRHVIDTITSKVVLILGRFTPKQKKVLDALRDELRKRDYLPILFDFDKSAGRDITETVSLLARMARFVVADITDAKSIPQELGIIVPHLPSVPVQPLLLEGNDEYSMLEHFKRYPWVLKTYVYESPEQLIDNLADRVIRPAEAKVLELRGPTAFEFKPS